MFEQEYESLRKELNENKKYVLERPLLIITAGMVLFDYLEGSEYIMLFPPVFILLLLFNLVFTKNRLDSSARIVVYIRQFIEAKEPENYRWETFLDEYRKECNPPGKSDHQDKKTKESGLRFYPMIYVLHLTAIIFLLLTEVYLFHIECLESTCCELDLNLITSFSLLLSLAGLFLLIYYGIKAHPNRVRAYFDSEGIKVGETLKNME